MEYQSKTVCVYCTPVPLYFSKLEHYNDTLRKLVWKARGDEGSAASLAEGGELYTGISRAVQRGGLRLHLPEHREGSQGCASSEDEELQDSRELKCAGQVSEDEQALPRLRWHRQLEVG